jgi:hypothetical protein
VQTDTFDIIKLAFSLQKILQIGKEGIAFLGGNGMGAGHKECSFIEFFYLYRTAQLGKACLQPVLRAMHHMCCVGGHVESAPGKDFGKNAEDAFHRGDDGKQGYFFLKQVVIAVDGGVECDDALG